ncbi:MAG TPA: class I adenylate-forming enzyme family protein [Ilumatobacteraceae bacterium]|nr:class I adenylate-forming enzyme family protein [Ilumatobacteraceae bacterium]
MPLMLFQQLLRDGANRTPDKIALRWVERDRALTYAEAVEQMDRMAGALGSLGVGKGDRVGIFAHNGIDYLAAMFGAWRLGAISALVNLQYADTLDYYVNDCQPKVLIYTGDHLATIDRHRANLPSVEHYVCMDGPQPGAFGLAELVASASSAPPDITAESDVAHLSYTSGTSGQPKGACLAHEPTSRATRCIAERLRLRSTDVSLGPTALSSSYQLVANLLPALHVGATVCVMSRWESAPGWDACERLGATILAANPTVLRDLVEESELRGRAPARLRAGLSGGGPVPPELKQRLRDDLGIPLCESYGQSELGGFVGLWAPDDPITDDRLLSCGRPLPDKEVRVLDTDGDEVPTGTIGELCLRGGFMAGYWNRPDKTAETLSGGWLHTGDTGFVDTEGYVFMRGRLSERLTVGGTHWYPRDVEEVLMRHPAVREAALVGVPDPHLGHRPVAFVTARDGHLPDTETLLQFVGDELGRPVPSMTVEVLDAMPMTPTGKISKAQLLENVARP